MTEDLERRLTCQSNGYASAEARRRSIAYGSHVFLGNLNA